MEEKSIFYNLKSPIKYQLNGNFSESSSIEMFAPTYKTYEHFIKLSQFYARAQKEYEMVMLQNQEEFKKIFEEIQANNIKKEDLEESKDTEEYKKEEHAEFKKFILGSNSVSFNDVTNEFLKLCRLACFVDSDNNVFLSKTLLEQVDPNDLVDMIIEYIYVFIRPSN